MSWQDNAFTSPDYIEYLNSLTGTLRRMWRDGDWDVSAGSFFTHWREAVHVVQPFTVTTDIEVWASLDYGFTHPTAVYWHVRLDGTVYTVAEHVEAGQLVPHHAQRIREITAVLNRDVSNLTAFVAGHDVFAQRGSADGRTIADQYADEGIVLDRANIDRINGAAEMLRRIGGEDGDPAPTWKVFNTCTRLIACIPEMQINPKRPEDVLKVDADRDGNGGDDPYDGVRYGLMEKKAVVAGGFAVQY